MFRRGRRLERERRTIDAMIAMYCRAHHATTDGLCSECTLLREYARVRLHRCPFQEDKPTCATCPIHCYRPALREQVQAVMRYAGPRMLMRHPVLAVFHMLDSRREAPPRRLRRTPPSTSDEASADEA